MFLVAKQMGYIVLLVKIIRTNYYLSEFIRRTHKMFKRLECDAFINEIHVMILKIIFILLSIKKLIEK